MEKALGDSLVWKVVKADGWFRCQFVAGRCRALGGAVPVAVGVGAADQRCDGWCVAGRDLAVGFVGVCRGVAHLLGWDRSI